LEERFGMAQFSHLLGHIEPIARGDTHSALTLVQVSKECLRQRERRESGTARRIAANTTKLPGGRLSVRPLGDIKNSRNCYKRRLTCPSILTSFSFSSFP
jgi:hypothetical protein